MMKKILIIWILMTGFLTGTLYAQMTFGLVPNGNSLVRSKEEAKLLTSYLEDRLEDRVTIRVFKDEASLFNGLRKKQVDMAVVSNVFYHEHADALPLLANFTRSDATTHKLLLIVSKSGGISSVTDLKKSGGRLALDETSRSRTSFLTRILKGDPKKIFNRITSSSQFVDTLSGLTNWNFNAACVEDGLLETVRSFDPGLLNQVRILKASKSLASDPVVARKGLSAGLRKKITKLLVAMETDSDGEQILLGLKITKFVSPLKKLSLYPKHVDPSQYRTPPKKKPLKPAEPQKKTTKPVIEDHAPAIVSKTETGKVLPGKVVTKPEVKEPAQTKEEAGSKKLAGDFKEETIPESGPAEVAKEKKVAKRTDTGKPVKKGTSPVEQKSEKRRFSIFTLTLGASVILLVLFLIVFFLILRRKSEKVTRVKPALKSKQRTEPKLPEPVQPVVEAKATPPSSSPAPEKAEGLISREEPSPKSVEDEKSSFIELRGELKTFRVPDLLQLMASCQNTGTLMVRSKHDEKCLHFRDGKIAAASCLDKDSKNKLGYILIKLGKITERERSRALALCAEQPSKRLGKALAEIGAIRDEDIQGVLRLQAEEIVFSLFLYPEGNFEFINHPPDIDPSEDLSLDVMSLLMEGARREDEWEKIRMAIPSMDIIFALIEGGKEKLNGTELTRDQSLTLSLINGERSIREICVRSTLVDFEVCNFIYRLIQLSVVKKVEVQ